MQIDLFCCEIHINIHNAKLKNRNIILSPPLILNKCAVRHKLNSFTCYFEF